MGWGRDGERREEWKEEVKRERARTRKSPGGEARAGENEKEERGKD